MVSCGPFTSVTTAGHFLSAGLREFRGLKTNLRAKATAAIRAARPFNAVGELRFAHL